MKKVRQWFAVLGLLAVATASAEAQSRRVTGTVKQTGSDMPVPSASVQIVGTALGAVTNEQGEFAVTVPAGAQALRVRRIGYKAATVPLAVGVATGKEREARERQLPQGIGDGAQRQGAGIAAPLQPREHGQQAAGAMAPARLKRAKPLARQRNTSARGMAAWSRSQSLSTRRMKPGKSASSPGRCVWPWINVGAFARCIHSMAVA